MSGSAEAGVSGSASGAMNGGSSNGGGDADGGSGGRARGGASGAPGGGEAGGGVGGATSDGGSGGSIGGSSAGGSGGASGAAAAGSSSGGASLGGAGSGGSSGEAGSTAVGGGGLNSGGAGGASAAVRLVAHYPFDETAGDVAANVVDATKNGTYRGDCTHPEGPIAGAVGLRNIAGTSGTTEWVELPVGLLSELSEMTLALWIRDLSDARAGGRAFHFSNGAQHEIYFAPHDIHPDSLLPGAHLGGTYGGFVFADQWSSSPDFTDRLWHHVAVSWSSSSIDLYIDGSIVGSTVSPGVVPSDLGSTSPNWLGRTLDDAFIGLYAQMDDLRIYDRALPAAVIAALYQMQ